MLQTGSLIDYLSVRELVTMIASLYPRPLDISDVSNLTGTTEIAGRRTNKLSGGQTHRFEVLRSFRNRRYLILSLAFPVVLYLAIAGANKHAHFDGLNFPLYFMTGMTALGTMAAVIGSGAEVVAAAKQHGPDIALLDIEMPGIDGLAAAGVLAHEVPACRSLVLTTGPGISGAR
jgi:hypothetical protein